MAAKRFAEKLVRDFRAGRLTFSQAVTQCHDCVDDKVGAEAFRIFRDEVRGK